MKACRGKRDTELRTCNLGATEYSKRKGTHGERPQFPYLDGLLRFCVLLAADFKRNVVTKMSRP
jgi:hypothetical protein